MRYDDFYPAYVPVGERRAKAEKTLQQLPKKQPGITPVIIAGNALATTWWGKSWNSNLERYADYRNRISRGRSYVRHRAVLDLQLAPGHITALVQGSEAQPYRVAITVDTLSANNWSTIRTACAGCFDSLSALLAGTFPQALKDLFFAKGAGLFPSPREIHFDCSCPDWASMCKHIAAALYGVGSRFDEDPSLFFMLRGITIDDIITQTVADTTQTLLRKAERQSATCWTMSICAMFRHSARRPPHTSPRPASVQPKPATRTKHAAHTQKTCWHSEHASRPEDRRATPPHGQHQAVTAMTAPTLLLRHPVPKGPCWRRWSKRWGKRAKASLSSSCRTDWDGRTYSSATPSVGQAPKGSLKWSLPASIGRKFEATCLTSGRRDHTMGDL
jgi:uncharacterized Zn finger protein